MLKIYDQNKIPLGYITKYKDLCIESDLSNGDKSLSFTYLARKGKEIQNEYYVETQTDRYVVKEISITSDGFPEYRCQLDLEELEADMFESFSALKCELKDAANLALAGTGWTVNTDITKVRSVATMKATPLTILGKIKDAWMCEIRYDNKNQVVYFRDQFGDDKGVFFTRGLNLMKVNLTNDSYDYYTRIIPIGADGLRISSVNDGKKYIENYQYSNKIRTLIWEDTSYEDAESLKEDAEKKLDDLSKPKKTYSADVADLAKQKPEYSIMAFGLGDTVLLLDEQTGIKDKQRIVKLTECPQSPEKNSCELSNTTLTFEEQQERIQAATAALENITNADGTVKVKAFEKDGEVWVETIVNNSEVVKNTTEQVTEISKGLTEAEAKIGTLETTTLTAAEAQLKYATIEGAKILEADIEKLTIKYGEFETTVSKELAANKAIIDKLDTKYVSIDLANIDKADVAELFVKMGLITSAVIENGHVTGYLDSVEVNANRITAGTLSVERLIINGSEKSLIYALNNAGELVSKSVDTLDGDILTDRTITADKLVAHSITANEITTSNIIGASGWINLAEGTFNYGNQISWDGKELYINPASIYIAVDDRYATKNDVDDIKVGARNLIRNAKTMDFEDYCFGGNTKFMSDENGNRLTDENGAYLIA